MSTRLPPLRSLVLLDWVDSATVRRWGSIEGATPDLGHCTSVGWLVAVDKEAILVASHLSRADYPWLEREGAGLMSVPRACLRKVVVLRKPGKG